MKELFTFVSFGFDVLGDEGGVLFGCVGDFDP